MNKPEIEHEVLKKFGLEHGTKPKHYETVAELLLNLDAPTCRKLIYGEAAVLPNLSLLDPACGSGAFLVAAMKTLINVYSAILGRIEFLGDKKLIIWKREIEQDHPSINYYIKKKIITNNLYGVDIMEEATEIAKLRLFLALVSSAQTVDQLEPLPNIDFNIMAGNSLIGMMRVDEARFNTLMAQPKKNAAGKIVKPATLFAPGTAQANLFAADLTQGYVQLINEKERLIRDYKNAKDLGADELQDLRNNIQNKKSEATVVLSQLLVEEFTTLGMQHETATWDEKAGKAGKPVKRPMNVEDIKALEAFHWGYEFSEIFKKKDGFDAIITNPPWEIFKPDAKEFFSEHSKLVTKKKMDIKAFEKEQNKLLQDLEIKNAWLEYQSRFPHVSLYYRKARQYKNQISIVNGKKAGTDINLYKLFTEQCFNVLKRSGYCGIVIPSGIYTDLGAKQLRQMLFNETKVTGLFCFENKKEIFENVHRSFKFVVLGFEKGQITTSFPAAFMRHDVKELEQFPKYGAMNISVDFVKAQSPESYSIPEIKTQIDFSLAFKMIAFPFLGERILDTWNISLCNEFHMTNDSHLFKPASSQDRLPLYEGKMIWQFDAHYAEAKYWINEKTARQAILGRKVDDGSVLDYQNYRLSFREIASNTNERALIATILPKNVFANHKLMVSDSSSEGLNNMNKLLLCALLNSFVFDFQVRQKTSTSISMHIFYQLTVPRLKSTHKWYKSIVERAAKLICTTAEFGELWKEVMKTEWNETVGVSAEEERAMLRAELDGIVAHIYGLTEEEFSYILGTFPLVAPAQREAALSYFKKIAPQFAPSASPDWQSIIAAGESPKLEFKSTLRVNIKAGNTVDKKMEQMVLKTIAAYLNSNSGTLLIGVDDAKNILGLDLDYASFSKPDKLDEFQKHLDTLIQNSLGNRFQRYLDISFPEVEGKTICAIVVKEKSAEPAYYTGENKEEVFYIRRQASTIDLKPSEALKYVQEHWK